MPTLTVADKAVTRGHVIVPRQGAWHAELWLDADTAPSGAVALSWADGEATWQGTVVRGGVVTEGGPAAVRLVGGAGGLGKALPGASYRNVSPRVIVGQILAALAGATQRIEAQTDIVQRCQATRQIAKQGLGTSASEHAGYLDRHRRIARPELR